MTDDSSEEGQSIEQASADGDAIVQWRVSEFENIEAYNNLCSGALPGEVGADGTWWSDEEEEGDWVRESTGSCFSLVAYHPTVSDETKRGINTPSGTALAATQGRSFLSS